MPTAQRGMIGCYGGLEPITQSAFDCIALARGEKRSLLGVCHALMSFELGVRSVRRSGCFRPSDRLARWDSHPLEIADFHGVLSL
jgi:hypothetical protein